MQLSADPETGLVSNSCFDPQTQEYTERYEETQSYSPHFAEYARELATQLSTRYHLAGKSVLEVGCGKGAFLIELCAISGARGIGIDPSFVAGRYPHSPSLSVGFLAERLAAHHTAMRPDLIVCRHTLEHIRELDEFLQLIRRVLLNNAGAALYIDVPDSVRIFAEGAFWDVYYEHCHYFTAGSLARILRRNGLVVTGLNREYAGQSLCAHAVADRHCLERAPEPPEIEEDIDETLTIAGEFANKSALQVRAWRDWFAGIDKERVVLWGGGSKAVGFLSMIDSDRISCAVDINPQKSGTFLPGSALPVIAPRDLADTYVDHVIVMNPVYVAEIATMLASLGLSPAVWTLGPLPIVTLARNPGSLSLGHL